MPIPYTKQNLVFVLKKHYDTFTVKQVLFFIMSTTSSYDTLHLIADGEEAFKSIIDCIRKARKSIHIKMFMWRDDTKGRAVLEALEQKIQTTPAIRIIIEKDAFGSRIYDLTRLITLGNSRGDMFSSSYGLRFIKDYPNNVVFHYVGSRSLFFIKLLKENDHSKVLVFDQNTPYANALMGGINLADEYLTSENHDYPDQGGWHDYMVYIQGPLASQLLTERSRKSPPLPVMRSLERGAELLLNVRDRRRVKKVILRELSRARTSVVLEHGYITDEAIIHKLRQISRRGVEVQVILPDRSDGFFHANMHSIYRLLKPSVLPHRGKMNLKVFLYRGMIHGKTLLIDDETTIIGSANLTSISFELMQETNGVFRDPEGLSREMGLQLSKDMQYCHEVTFKTIPPYNRLRAFLERLAI